MNEYKQLLWAVRMCVFLTIINVFLVGCLCGTGIYFIEKYSEIERRQQADRAKVEAMVGIVKGIESRLYLDWSEGEK